MGGGGDRPEKREVCHSFGVADRSTLGRAAAALRDGLDGENDRFDDREGSGREVEPGNGIQGTRNDAGRANRARKRWMGALESDWDAWEMDVRNQGRPGGACGTQSQPRRSGSEHRDRKKPLGFSTGTGCVAAVLGTEHKNLCYIRCYRTSKPIAWTSQARERIV